MPNPAELFKKYRDQENGYIPTPVTPTKDYPYPTDREFIDRKAPEPDLQAELKAAQQEHDDLAPGMLELPTMDDEGGEATGIFEIDGKHYILPTQVEGQKFPAEEAINRFLDTGEHLGVFDAEDNASIYEDTYLGKK